LHLYFGNVGLRLRPHKLRQWRGTLAETCEHQVVRVQAVEARCLSLPSPIADQAYLFSLEELFLLQDLLTSAVLLLEVDEILERAERS